MENSELIKRAEDLRARCEKSCTLTHTNFLTPAESYEISLWAKHRSDCSLVFSGGQADCERTVAFFLPYYMDEESFDVSEYISAMKITAHFGAPGHRDYMGSILGMGIGREWLGDIRVVDNVAYVLCLPSVLEHLLGIEKVGRCGVKCERLELSGLPEIERKVKKVSFSVMSMRLDAVAAGLFKLSRSECVRQINEGRLTLNYKEVTKADAPVREGDILSLRGSGKGQITGTGGSSRKGRLFVYGEIYK